MDVPAKSLSAIRIPVISLKHGKKKIQKKILELYQKTSLNLLILGFSSWRNCLLNMDEMQLFLGDAL